MLWEQMTLGLGDPDQRAFFVRHAQDIVNACERTGLLDADEVSQWRALIEHDGTPPPAPGKTGAAERHLERLLAAVPPMTRGEDPPGLRAGQRFRGALEALHACGLLSDEAARRWRARHTAASAPWLGDDELSDLQAATGHTLISIPPSSPEEAEADAQTSHDWEQLVRQGTARRVHVADRLQRADGLAMLAVVTRTDSTEVVFHHVGEPHGEAVPGFAHLAAFSQTIDGLVPPALTDDRGVVYEPAAQGPVRIHGVGGESDPLRPQVLTGVWRYQPAAPDSVKAFTVETPDGHLLRFGVPPSER